MVAKRKAVTQIAEGVLRNKKDMEEVDSDEASEVDSEDQGVEEQDQAQTTSKTVAQQEKETAEARKKELKSMYVAQLKELMSSYGFEPGSRDLMMAKIVAHEVKLRAVQREKEAEIRAVVVNKKQELDALSAAEVKKLCDNAGVKGVLSKVDRVQKLMTLWQEADGIEKAMQQLVQEKRHQQLSAMETATLLKMCKRAGLDPYVKDVMVPRIIRKEHEAGYFARPLPEKQVEPDSGKHRRDMIDDFLAKEAKRKKELELKKQQDDAVSKRIAELKPLPIDKLKKLVVKNGLDATGKKEELIVALVKLDERKAAIDARKQELKSMGKEALTDLTTSKGVKAGSVDAMVNGLLELEEKRREALAAYEVRVDELLAAKKVELEAMSMAKLKEMCASKGLKAAKEERVTSLINAAREEDEIHKTLERMARDARKEALLAMDKTVLVKLCEEYGADPHVPEVMVELLLEHEIEAGELHAKEPAAKKARASK